MWGDAFVGALARQHQVITYDHRGIGASSRAEGPFTIADLADDAAALRDALGHESAHVMGISMGGTGCSGAGAACARAGPQPGARMHERGWTGRLRRSWPRPADAGDRVARRRTGDAGGIRGQRVAGVRRPTGRARPVQVRHDGQAGAGRGRRTSEHRLHEPRHALAAGTHQRPDSRRARRPRRDDRGG
ncbi:alpha/beta fold hydrolase [Aeromicrobium sp. UC242_57]|uniref:alpha/beta fold hydrolase n=1 Tax=Aeromicrobium sp. UC242_57 TaxID=3374624 RepID=UPI003797BECB